MGLQLNEAAGLDMTHAGYKGSTPALTDVMGNHLPLMFDGLATSLPLIKTGKIKAFAVSSPQRSAALPDVQFCRGGAGRCAGRHHCRPLGLARGFRAVGFPGLVMALLFLLVPDYKNVIVKMRPAVKSSDTKAYLHRMYGTLSRGKTLLLVCIAGSFQLIVVSTMWSSVPSFLNRYHGMTASTAAKNAGVLVLCGAVGAVFWGGVADRLARRRSAYKLMMLVGTTSATAALFIFAFSVPLSPSIQYPLILLGGFMMTCTVGVSVSAVLDVTHPELRATGSACMPSPSTCSAWRLATKLRGRRGGVTLRRRS